MVVKFRMAEKTELLLGLLPAAIALFIAVILSGIIQFDLLTGLLGFFAFYFAGFFILEARSKGFNTPADAVGVFAAILFTVYGLALWLSISIPILTDFVLGSVPLVFAFGAFVIVWQSFTE